MLNRKDPQFKECTGFIKLDKDLITSHNTHNMYRLFFKRKNNLMLYEKMF